MDAMRSDLRHNPTSVIDFLQRHDGAAGLLPVAERLLKLKQDLFAAMPATLRDSCEVTGFDDATVLLRVASASAAAKLRQTLPRLQESLAERGWKVDGIRVRVKPRAATDASVNWTSPNRPGISSSGVAAFEDLGQQLEDSPLRAAVERLVRRRAPRA
jgi:hypothetical protein